MHGEREYTYWVYGRQAALFFLGLRVWESAINSPPGSPTWLRRNCKAFPRGAWEREKILRPPTTQKTSRVPLGKGDKNALVFSPPCSRGSVLRSPERASRTRGLSIRIYFFSDKFTAGTARSASSVISNNSAGLKLNIEAMILPGNTCCAVLNAVAMSL